MTRDRFAHCTFCGARFIADRPWPRRCAACGETSYQNPKPVAVAVQPVAGGLLTVRRGIPPAAGRLALPGGYIDMGESWQEATTRELFEETGLPADPSAVRLYDTVSAPDGTLLVFGLLPPLPSTAPIPLSAPNAESLGWELVIGPVELGFPTHTEVVRRYFAEA